jgi:hypothetical protein
MKILEMKSNIENPEKGVVLECNYEILKNFLIMLKNNPSEKEILIHELENSLAILDREIISNICEIMPLDLRYL